MVLETYLRVGADLQCQAILVTLRKDVNQSFPTDGRATLHFQLTLVLVSRSEASQYWSALQEYGGFVHIPCRR